MQSNPKLYQPIMVLWPYFVITNMTWSVSFDDISVSLDCCITEIWPPINKAPVRLLRFKPRSVRYRLKYCLKGPLNQNNKQIRLLFTTFSQTVAYVMIRSSTVDTSVVVHSDFSKSRGDPGVVTEVFNCLKLPW